MHVNLGKRVKEREDKLEVVVFYKVWVLNKEGVHYRKCEEQYICK
jgi:hypothetical protein